MVAFLASFIFVTLAEMGDKTQLLAMAFAAKYKAREVLLAVFIATLLNHSLAVAVGRLLTVFIPLGMISLAASVSFIIFGLWTLRGDKLSGEDEKISVLGPVAPVAIAFFLAEMGDKTQLATISLAVKYHSVFNVLIGTTLGMVVADAIGIVAGVAMRKHVPEEVIKWVSAVIFVLFGLTGVYKALSAGMGTAYAWGVVLIISFITVVVAHYLVKIGMNRRRS